MTRPWKHPGASGDSNPGSSALEADTLTTRPARRWTLGNPERHTAKHGDASCRSPRDGQDGGADAEGRPVAERGTRRACGQHVSRKHNSCLLSLRSAQSEILQRLGRHRKTVCVYVRARARAHLYMCECVCVC